MFYSILALIGTDTDFSLMISTASIRGHLYVYLLGVEGWQNLFLFILFSDNHSVVCID